MQLVRFRILHSEFLIRFTGSNLFSMKNSVFLFIPILCAVACTRSFRYLPAAEQPGPTELIFTHGAANLFSKKDGIECTLDLVSRGQRDMSLRLRLHNGSDSSLLFQPEKVRVTGFDASGQAVDFKVWTADGYRRHKRNQAILIASVAVVATVATAVAVSENGGSSSNDDDDSHHHSHDAFWYAPVPIVVAPPPVSFWNSPDGLMRRHTLFEGETLFGAIKIRAETAHLSKILVEIPIDGGYRKFVFDDRERLRR